MSDKDAAEDKSVKNAEESKPAPKDQIVETRHTFTIGGQEIKYTVTAGTIVL